MKHLFCVAVALLFRLVTTSAEPDDCGLVTPNQTVVWSRITGEWYQIFNSHRPMDIFSSCYASRDFEKTMDGIRFSAIDYHLGKGTYGKITWNPLCDLNGLCTGAGSSKFEKELDEDSDQSPIELREAHNIACGSSQFVIHTDYENYVIFLSCIEEKQRAVWIQARSTKPSPEEMLRILSGMISIGNGWGDIKLFPSGCSSVDNLQDYTEE